jgi:hypothetical protein
VFTAKRYAETHDPSIIWEGHKAGRYIGYSHIEMPTTRSVSLSLQKIAPGIASILSRNL